MTGPERKPRILAFAYACEPSRGSEPAAGWRWAQMLAHLGETWVITRANNRSSIESQCRTDTELSVHFVYVDLPGPLRWWKRGQRGVRLYYVLWQIVALRVARKLKQETHFDVVWHLTLANAWVGSVAALLGSPFVYGPVGGAVRPPWQLMPTLGAKGLLYEFARMAAHTAGRYLNPLARLSWRRASLVLVQNEETRRWLPRRYAAKTEICPNVIVERSASKTVRDRGRTMLFAGRLMPLKGIGLAVRALEMLPGWRLVVYGDGQDLGRLMRLAARRRVDDRVEFRGWVERDEVLRAMCREASVFVFPSLHDEAGWAVVEAMASGVPVVVLDVGGPAVLVDHEMRVVPAGVGETALRIAQQVVKSAEISPERVLKRARHFSPETKLEIVKQILAERAILPRTSEAAHAPSGHRIPPTVQTGDGSNCGPSPSDQGG